MRPLFFVIFLILFYSCARVGSPEGGPKDETPPLMVTANPPYESINFDKKSIKIYFNEYIKLKDLNKQLVVSPPLKNPPSITPQGTPSKFIEIKILDTLLLNTTYTFNFGNSVQDNNESNELEKFKYVFSTGNYIDSLYFSGNVKDAFLNKPPKNTNVLLYKIDSTYTDSIVYKRKPNYVTSTSDSTNFDFSNLQKGKYFLIALRENNSDYLFNSKTDKIGFLLDTIFLPKDSILEKPLELFKEETTYNFKKAKEVAKGHIIFGYEGNGENLEINLLSSTSKDFKSIIKFEPNKDTLNLWFSPVEKDSLVFKVSNKDKIDTVTVKLRKKQIDSLLISSPIKGTLHLRDTFFLESNNPITHIDTSKISLLDKDSIAIDFRSVLSEKRNIMQLIFDKQPIQNYNFTVLPEAFLDIYSQGNDSLQYNIRTKEIEDYGQITLNIDNKTSSNVIIDLLDEKENIVERKLIKTAQEILVFKLLEPKKYVIRGIIDKNKNNKWDTGNFLNKILPEKIVYFKKLIDVRPNYYMNESFEINR